MKKVDPITLAVVEGALFATVREMRVTLIRTSYAPILYETHDFSCCLLSRGGEIMALSLDDVPLHTFPMAVQMKTVFEKFGDEIYPGDVMMMNDPFSGGTHLNDVAIVVPFFFEDKLVLFIGIRAHWGDVGGATPGSFSGRDTEIYQEGIRIPPIKIHEKGKPNQAFLDVLFANVRFVEDRKGDFLAMLDTSRTAEGRLSEIYKKYGVDTVLECLDTLLDTTEQRMRRAISKLPDGEYHDEYYLDNSGNSLDPLIIKSNMEITGDKLTIDWTGTAPQVEGPINGGVALAPNGAFTALKSLLDPEAHINGGSFRPVSFINPEGTILNARPPAAMAGFFEIILAAKVSVLRLFSQVLPEMAMGEQRIGCNHTIISGWDPTRMRPFLFYEYQTEGTAATTKNDGQNMMLSAGLGDIPCVLAGEIAENMMPVQIESYELRQNSGGAGLRRGGLSATRKVRILSDSAMLSVLTERVVIPPFGASGAYSASPNSITVIRDNVEIQPSDIPGKLRAFPLKYDDVVVVKTVGGGGVGDPLERDPELVKDDLFERYISPEVARDIYGVVIIRGEVDQDRTQELRQQIRGQRQHFKVIGSETDEYHERGWRLCSMNREAAVDIGVEDGDPVEYIGKGSMPLRAWIKVVDNLPKEGIPLGPAGRKILQVEEGDLVEIRA